VAKKPGGWAEYSELAGLFFLQGMASGMWLVPLSGVLNAHGLAALRPYAYATSAVAAFISPLVFGAMADRHVSPARVLRWLSAASAVAMIIASWSISRGWPAALVLILIQIYSLAATPTTSIASTLIFSRLRDSPRQYGPLRAVATFGWMCGCWIISALNIDASPTAGYVGAAVWVALSLFTFAISGVAPPPAGKLTFRQRMGWDALVLLRNHDHRVVFLAVALFSITLAAFYPFTPPHLQHLGLERTSAWMSLGQVTEILAMLGLAGFLSRWRLKWIFAAGLSVGVLRFLFCSLDKRGWLLAGVTLHGLSFTLVFITAQIYLNERIEPLWRGRAQALMSLMNGGFGNLIGYVGTGFWFQACGGAAGTRWSFFWGGLAAAVASVLTWFVTAYHGRSTGFRKPTTAASSAAS
jgi:MFS family permease